MDKSPTFSWQQHVTVKIVLRAYAVLRKMEIRQVKLKMLTFNRRKLPGVGLKQNVVPTQWTVRLLIPQTEQAFFNFQLLC